MKASCQCGQVSYRLLAAPKVVMACHCKECQKLSTSPYSVTAMVAERDIEFTGVLKEWSRTADSGNQNIAKFCPECGNRIYHFNPNDSSMIKLKLKPTELNDFSAFEPTVHVWTSEKQNWVKIPKYVKTFEKQP